MARPPRTYLAAENTAQGMLERLGLTHSASNWAALLEESVKENRSHEDFLKLLLERELAWRHGVRVERLIQAAHFPRRDTLDSFDWGHPSDIPKALILNAFQIDFIEKKEHLIFMGPGGVGKTHLAIALGLAACQREIPTLFTTVADMINHLVASQADHSLRQALKKYLRPRLLILDELGYLPIDEQGRNLIFQVISKRAETASIIVTTNKPFKNWGEVFRDTAVATAIAERLVEHGELIRIQGASYRIKRRRQRQLGLQSLEKE